MKTTMLKYAPQGDARIMHFRNASDAQAVSCWLSQIGVPHTWRQDVIEGHTLTQRVLSVRRLELAIECYRSFEINHEPTDDAEDRAMLSRLYYALAAIITNGTVDWSGPVDNTPTGHALTLCRRLFPRDHAIWRHIYCDWTP